MRAFGVFLLSAALGGCNFFGSTTDPTLDASIDGALPDGALPDVVIPGSVGSSCNSPSECRSGLVCAEGTCQASGTTGAGEGCELSGDCMDGLFCSISTRVCENAGAGEDGAACVSDGDCVAGLSCAIEGFVARCRQGGTGDIGTPCANQAACLPGLACAPAGNTNVCASPPAGTIPPFPIPSPWAGEECGSEEEGPARALFEVPRGESDGDFFRLPFPNDIRRDTDGRLDYSGHPTPATALPIDIIDRYLRASEEDLTGFSTNATSYFRFSAAYDWESIGDNFRLVNITPDSPSYGEEVVLQWQVTAGRVTKYMCNDWLAFRPRHGDPLLPGTTYAAVVERGFLTTEGAPFGTSADFDAVISDTAPSDNSLARAHATYAPLRAWMADTGVPASDLLAATVFTTQEPETLIPALRQVIRDLAEPAVSDLTLCDEGVTSPCDDGSEQRSCNAPNPNYFEVHGRIRLPIFQQGTPPYLTPEDGGGIETDASGVPTIARSEDVCFAMTIPRNPPPDEGFPLLLYGHGTGGAFTTPIRNGVAEDVAGEDGDGMPVNAVTLAIDFPQHGARRGESSEDPDLLFFNFTNPRAARDNVMQGTADLMSVIHWAQSYNLESELSPTGEAIRFSERIALFMHSQGATHASLMFPYESDLRAILLSGNGGDLTQSLLTKSQPVNIAQVLPFALLDADGTGNLPARAFHPALAMFQAFFDRVDPVNFARRVHRAPVEGRAGQHVFMTYGLGDTFSTEETMSAYSIAATLPIAGPALTSPFGPVVDGPIESNLEVNGERYTVGLRQYEPGAGVDGHFVSTRTEQGRADALRFLHAALRGETPSIGAP